MGMLWLTACYAVNKNRVVYTQQYKRNKRTCGLYGTSVTLFAPPQFIMICHLPRFLGCILIVKLITHDKFISRHCRAFTKRGAE